MDNRIALSPFLFLIICFFSLAITAQSNDTTTASTAPNQEARVGWVAGPNQRGTLTLVYGCLSTIFASTWTVLHLNVPGPHDEWWRKALRKAKWMAVTVLFPEFVFSKAVCELRMAVANLRDMHEAMKKARAELRWEDSVQREYPRRVETVIWTWEADFGKGMRLLHWLFGLGKLPATVEDQEDGREVVCENENKEGSEKPAPTVVGRGEVESLEISAAQPQPQPDNMANHDPVKNARSRPGDARASLRPNDANHDGERVPYLSFSSQDSHDKGEVRRRWTLVHCLYANMGGLVPYPTQGIGSGSGGPGAQPVTTPMLAETIRRGGCDSLKHFVLDRADIEDKSKADWLLRTIAVMQIVWLVLNVAARAIARVPVTQLEIATVAFSITAIATYAANWWKPKDIGQPTALPRVLQGHRIEHWAIPEDYRNFQSFVNRTLKPSYTRELQIDGWIDRVRNDLTWMRGDPPMPRMFYALMAVSSLVFGGFHCLAWNVQFPSETEQVLWRAASIMSAALPGVSLALTSVINVLATTVSEKRFLAVVRKTLVPLHRLPEDFWRLLCEEPKCLQWPLHAWLVLRTKLHTQLLGPLDWEEEPPVTTGELNPADEETAAAYRHHFETYWSDLKHFRQYWLEVDNGVLSRRGPEPLFLHYYDCIHDSAAWGRPDAQVASALWWAYEAYLKSKLRHLDPDLQTLRVLDFLIDTRRPIRYMRASRELFVTYCDRASKFVTILSSIIYAVSRLAILILLFTSLRSVPEAVYENSPWTRFLPNIS